MLGPRRSVHTPHTGAEQPQSGTDARQCTRQDPGEDTPKRPIIVRPGSRPSEPDTRGAESACHAQRGMRHVSHSRSEARTLTGSPGAPCRSLPA